MPQTEANLKRKLRDVKRIEIALRFNGNAAAAEGKLVWDEFFSLKTNLNHEVRYTYRDILKLDRQKLKEVLDEYFYNVYYRIYQENRLPLDSLYDPNLLYQLGLPALANQADIKRRFRELVKKYHPDLGGDSEKFIELMQIIDQLAGKD